MELEFIKIDQILNITLFKAEHIYFHNYYISDSSFKIICQNSYWDGILFRKWTFYYEETKGNENEVFIKNKFKSIYFRGWKCRKLCSKVKFDKDQNYELHDSNIKDFIMNFFKDTTFENKFEIEFNDSFNYPEWKIDNSYLTKLLNKGYTEISGILNRSKRYSEFSNNILGKINGIDHIEIQTYLNNYAIKISKLGESKFNCYLTSPFDSSFELSRLSSFHRKSFEIWKAVEFNVDDEIFIYIGDTGYYKYFLMNSRDETAELFDWNSFNNLNLDFVAHSLNITFIRVNDYYRDFLNIILKKLIYDNDELESISIQGKIDSNPFKIREIVRRIESVRNFEKKMNKEIKFRWVDAIFDRYWEHSLSICYKIGNGSLISLDEINNKEYERIDDDEEKRFDE